MADEIKRFKPITEENVFKGIDKTYSTQTVWSGLNLSWYYVERGEEDWSTLSDNLKNLFHSFGLSREDEEDWFRVFNVYDWYNAKRMLIASIPQSGCGSYIDGSTLRINVPTATTTQDYFTTFYGSTFASYPDPVTNRQIALEYEENMYGGAFCYLFANTQGEHALITDSYVATNHHPYTGNVNGGPNPNSGATSFDQDMDATPALSFSQAQAKLTPHLSATHWSQGDDGNDRPYGVALLEKGLFIIFDMYGRHDFLDNSNGVWDIATPWTSATQAWYAWSSKGEKQNIDDNFREAINFSGAVADNIAQVICRTVTQGYKNIYFCHAGQNEFNSTSNHTYNSKKAYFRPEEADSLWVTEIGLYDDDDILLAYAKLSEPVEKNKLETLTFKVEIEL